MEVKIFFEGLTKLIIVQMTLVYVLWGDDWLLCKVK